MTQQPIVTTLIEGMHEPGPYITLTHICSCGVVLAQRIYDVSKGMPDAAAHGDEDGRLAARHLKEAHGIG